MAEKYSFYYLGDDEAYFKALQGEFKARAKMQLTFLRTFAATEESIQTLFTTVNAANPQCVFVDFSRHTPNFLHLARILANTPTETPRIVVGLVDYLSPPEVLRESIATGVNLSFIKSSEIFDVVFNVAKLVAPSAVSGHGFATASLKEEWEGGVVCKVGFVHEQGLHLETNQNFGKGEKILIEHYWQEKKIVPSKEAFIKATSETSMFYQFKHNTDIEFSFVDEFIPPGEMDPADIEIKMKDRLALVDEHKHRLKKWISTNVGDSQEKITRLLVVDDSFQFYNDQKRSNRRSYTIRCVPYLDDYAEELSRIRPQIIGFNMVEIGKNNIDSVQKLVDVLKAKFSELNPYIVIFHTKLKSEELQANLKYPRMMGFEDELSVEVLNKMADSLDKKMRETVHPHQIPGEKLFVKSSHPMSVAEILKSVTVLKLSEVDMIIETSLDIPPGTNIHFKKPVDMFVNFQPDKGQGKIPAYYGVIHGLGEEEKKSLRRYVNSIFFRDHDAQLSAESDEFKNLNEIKLQEKLLLLQKEKEAQELLLLQKIEEKKAKKPAEVAPVEEEFQDKLADPKVS